MKISSILRIWVPLTLCLATGAAQAEPIFTASFEEKEGYRLRKLEGQQGWSIYGGNKNEAIVTALPGSTPESACVKVTRGEAFLHQHFTEQGLANPVVFSIRLRLDPEGGGAEEPRCRVFLSNTEPNRRYGGISFGIKEQDGLLTAIYRNGSEWLPIPAGPGISPGTFYRFEVRLYPSTKTFDLRLFEDGNQTPLGEISGAKFRDSQGEINHLMLNGTPGAYFDDITLTGF